MLSFRKLLILLVLAGGLFGNETLAMDGKKTNPKRKAQNQLEEETSADRILRQAEEDEEIEQRRVVMRFARQAEQDREDAEKNEILGVGPAYAEEVQANDVFEEECSSNEKQALTLDQLPEDILYKLMSFNIDSSGLPLTSKKFNALSMQYDKGLVNYAFPKDSTFKYVIGKLQRMNAGNLKALKLVIATTLTEEQITTIISFIPRSIEYLEIDLGQNTTPIHKEGIEKKPSHRLNVAGFPNIIAVSFRSKSTIFNFSIFDVIDKEQRKQTELRFTQYPFGSSSFMNCGF